MHRHEWETIKLNHYDTVGPYGLGNMRKFGGTEITLMCQKCNKTKHVDYPKERLEAKDFVGTPYEIKENYTNIDDVSDTLTALGDINDADTYELRYNVLVANLSNTSSRIRVGAVLGLARMKDPDSVACLKEALENEPYDFLKRYIQQAIELLEGKQ